jgi:hypothetical protein
MLHFHHFNRSRRLEHMLNPTDAGRLPICNARGIDFRPIGDYIERQGIPATFWRLQDTTTARDAIAGSGQDKDG